MNKWTSEQRIRITFLAIGTAAVAALIWFQLIGFLQSRLREQANKIAIARNQVILIRAGIAKEKQFKEEIELAKRELLGFEGKMAQGDPYRWAINFLSDVGSRHDVNIIEFGPPQDEEWSIPPRTPYRAQSYFISGTGYYSDLGSFVADLENSSPFIRLKSLTIQSVAPGLAGSAASERLAFRLDFITLAKSATP